METVREAGRRKAEELGLTEEEFSAMLYEQSSPRHLNRK
jgi:hypothetical protein